MQNINISLTDVKTLVLKNWTIQSVSLNNSNNMQDVYKNIGDNYQSRKYNVLIVFDGMIAYDV